MVGMAGCGLIVCEVSSSVSEGFKDHHFMILSSRAHARLVSLVLKSGCFNRKNMGGTEGCLGVLLTLD